MHAYPHRALLTAAPLFALSCPVVTEIPYPAHCWHASGDATCRAHFGSERPFCTRDTPPCNTLAELGCVAELPAIDECHSPCGGGRSAVEDSSCLVADESTTAPADLGPSPECTADTDCDSATPLCLDGSCVACIDHADCPGLCDADHACIPCWSHTQCPGEAGCDLAIGQCLDPNLVVHVGLEFDVPDLAGATASLSSESGTLVVHASVDQHWGASIPVVADQVVVVRAPEAEPVVVTATAPIFEVTGRLYLDRLTIDGDLAARTTGGIVHARSLAVRSLGWSALECTSGTLHVESSMLVAPSSPLYVGDDCRMILRSSSVFGTSGPALLCEGVGLAAGSLIRKSLLVSNDDIAVYCHYSSNTVGQPPEDVVIDKNWFVDPFAGDLHLAVDPEPLATRDWLPGDPLVDFDGEPREPQDYVGADVPAG